jgi:hypothetical protein
LPKDYFFISPGDPVIKTGQKGACHLAQDNNDQHYTPLVVPAQSRYCAFLFS